jgi:hypothetical protein
MNVFRLSVIATSTLALIAPPATIASADELANLKSAIAYYQGAESLQAKSPDEKIHVAPELQTGKIGKAFLIERRTVNRIADPDFSAASTPGQTAWITIGAPQFTEQGGYADAAGALVTSENYLRQSFTNLSEGTLYCLSVYAKCAASGSLKLSVKSGAENQQAISPALGAEYSRYSVSFVAGAPTATITIQGTSEKSVQVDAAQLEAGQSWPSSFVAKSGVARGAEWVDVPARPEIYNPLQGTVAFWIKPHWLGQTSTQCLSLFAAYKDPTIAYSKNTNFFNIGAYANPTKKGWENGFNITFRDKAGKTNGYTPVTFDGSLAPNEWHHLAVTWKIVPGGESNTEFYLDGKRAGELKFVPDEIEAPANVYAGYYAGGHLDGLLDELYLFKRPLSESEVATLYNRATPLS